MVLEVRAAILFSSRRAATGPTPSYGATSPGSAVRDARSAGAAARGTLISRRWVMLNRVLLAAAVLLACAFALPRRAGLLPDRSRAAGSHRREGPAVSQRAPRSSSTSYPDGALMSMRRSRRQEDRRRITPQAAAGEHAAGRGRSRSATSRCRAAAPGRADRRAAPSARPRRRRPGLGTRLLRQRRARADAGHARTPPTTTRSAGRRAAPQRCSLSELADDSVDGRPRRPAGAEPSRPRRATCPRRRSIRSEARDPGRSRPRDPDSSLTRKRVSSPASR